MVENLVGDPGCELHQIDAQPVRKLFGEWMGVVDVANGVDDAAAAYDDEGQRVGIFHAPRLETLVEVRQREQAAAEFDHAERRQVMSSQTMGSSAIKFRSGSCRAFAIG